MTPKQAERLKAKISGIKKTLAAEKRKIGCYDDGRGLRYLPTRYFIQLGDFKGGLAYLNWFHKNFPDDGGFPVFLLEWAILLFTCGRTRDAEKKVYETFCANTYLFDRFFGRPINPVDKWEGSNWEAADFTEGLGYSSEQPDLADFSNWLGRLLESEDFKTRCEKYIEIHRQLKTEKRREIRQALVMEARQLQETM